MNWWEDERYKSLHNQARYLVKDVINELHEKQGRKTGLSDAKISIFYRKRLIKRLLDELASRGVKINEFLEKLKR
jgi:hypothetical protein